MRPAPRCSVIIPTYNRAELLRLTLESLARQTLPPGDFGRPTPAPPWPSPSATACSCGGSSRKTGAGG
jgi:GT2 family glycosyltransferase